MCTLFYQTIILPASHDRPSWRQSSRSRYHSPLRPPRLDQNAHPCARPHCNIRPGVAEWTKRGRCCSREWASCIRPYPSPPTDATHETRVTIHWDSSSNDHPMRWRTVFFFIKREEWSHENRSIISIIITKRNDSNWIQNIMIGLSEWKISRRIESYRNAT